MKKRQGRHFKVAPVHERTGIRGIVFRSKAERIYAAVLDLECRALGIDWVYEPVIKLTKKQRYRPDFGVVRNDELILFHEIKAFRKTKTGYRPVDSRWPTTKKLWQEFGTAKLMVWRHVYGDRFKCMEIVEPDPYPEIKIG